MGVGTLGRPGASGPQLPLYIVGMESPGGETIEERFRCDVRGDAAKLHAGRAVTVSFVDGFPDPGAWRKRRDREIRRKRSKEKMRQIVIEASALLVAAASAGGSKDGRRVRVRWHGKAAAADPVSYVDDAGYLELSDRHFPAPVRSPRERTERRRLRQEREGCKWNHGRKARGKFGHTPSAWRDSKPCIGLLEEVPRNFGEHAPEPTVVRLSLGLLLEENLAGAPPAGFSAADQAELDAELAAIELGFDI